jgi:hypothetical protein
MRFPAGEQDGRGHEAAALAGSSITSVWRPFIDAAISDATRSAAAIRDCVDQSNQNPHVLVWTASVESIMQKIATKCKEALDALR